MPYIACEQYNFEWVQQDLDRFRALWKSGAHIEDIAAKLKRRPAEVAMLIIDQADQGKIAKRKGGAYGEPKKFTPQVRQMMCESFI